MKMRYLKKWIGLLGLLFVLTFLCSTVSAETTSFWNADVYDMQQGKIVGEIKLPCANGKVYLDQNGKSVALGFVEELNSVISDGNKIYYTVCKTYDDRAYSKGMLYQINIDGSSKKNLLTARIDSNDPVLELVGCYDDELYYVKAEEAAEINCPFYSYNIKTQKNKKVVKKNSGIVRQYGKYFFMHPATGDIWPLPYTVYNAKTGKACVFTKKGCTYYCKGNKIYYAEFIKETGPSYSFAIKRTDMNGKNKKTLAKISSVSSIIELTDKYVKYSDMDYQEHIKKF